MKLQLILFHKNIMEHSHLLGYNMNMVGRTIIEIKLKYDGSFIYGTNNI